jgi:hypothetical protein
MYTKGGDGSGPHAPPYRHQNILHSTKITTKEQGIGHEVITFKVISVEIR